MKKLRVATGGCFALIHPGSLALFWYLRDVAGPEGEVEVYMNADESLVNLKGKEKLVYTETERFNLLKSIRFIDNVFVFNAPDPSRIIWRRRPDVWIKSSGHRNKDEMAETKVVEQYGGRVEIWESPVKISTTQIMERIKNG